YPDQHGFGHAADPDLGLRMRSQRHSDQQGKQRGDFSHCDVSSYWSVLRTVCPRQEETLGEIERLEQQNAEQPDRDDIGIKQLDVEELGGPCQLMAGAALT